jgi:hypothetical protein
MGLISPTMTVFSRLALSMLSFIWVFIELIPFYFNLFVSEKKKHFKNSIHILSCQTCFFNLNFVFLFNFLTPLNESKFNDSLELFVLVDLSVSFDLDINDLINVFVSLVGSSFLMKFNSFLFVTSSAFLI